MKRTTRSSLAKATLAVLERGRYEIGDARVDISANIDHAQRETRTYEPRARLRNARGNHSTVVEVTGETSLAAAERLVLDGHRPVVLNFASAKNPGGGFLNGAEAQEESLARNSALYACIASSPMYAHHRSRRDPLYAPFVIYSPDVPVFRHDDGSLRDEPFPVSFITSPAPNAGVVLRRKRSRAGDVERAMRERMRRVLAVASRHHHEVVVLGAWGCGVFRNDPESVARWWQDALHDQFPGAFRHVVHPVLDRPGGNNIRAFERVLASDDPA